MLKTNKLLAVFMLLLLAVGCAGAGTDRHERTEVEIHRKSAVSPDESKMLEFCRNLD